MASIIAVLEDNQERIELMKACLEDRFHQFEHRFFANAQEMIAFLKENLQRVLLLSLDHDLEMIPKSNGKCFDPGDGKQVAEFLAGIAPSCPIILHSTNSDSVQGMTRLLRTAGWKTIRVIPTDGNNWIEAIWLRAVRDAIVESAKPKSAAIPARTSKS